MADIMPYIETLADCARPKTVALAWADNVILMRDDLGHVNHVGH